MRRWLLALVALTACGEPGSLVPRGSVSRDVGGLTLLLIVVGGLVFVLVLVLLALAARRNQSRPDPSRTRRLVLGGGVALPVVVLVPLTVVMLFTGIRLGEREADLEVEVVGHQFWWEVRYPGHGVVTANEIHIPADTSVRLVLRSADVIHSFWVPTLAGKVDMIPGKTNELHLDAEEPGTYRGFCAEFCGLQHGNMRFLLIAQEEEAFAGWIADQAEPARAPEDEAASRGFDVFLSYGCGGCHTVRGTEADGQIGPDLTHLASRETLAAGMVENRRGNLAGWVVDPHGIKPGNLMPPTPLSGPELSDLVDFLEGLE